MKSGSTTPAPFPVVVQKFGGSSLAEIDDIERVARKLVETQAQGVQVVAVVSAMGKTTDRLVGYAREIDPDPEPRELDMLLSSGERESTALLAMAIRKLGVPAVSMSGAMAGILTDEHHNEATILEVRPFRVRDALDRGQIVVVAGFQGESYRGEITTLGRGGSDTTAVALAAALDADHCDIFSDVDGVYSGDPRALDDATRIDQLGYEEMQELARHGARVLNAQAVEFARGRQIAIFARATRGGEGHTVIRKDEAFQERIRTVRAHGVAGVAGRDDILDIQLRELRREKGLLNRLAAGDVLVAWDDTADGTLHLIVSTENIADANAFAKQLEEDFGPSVTIRSHSGAASIVGSGCGSRTAALFEARAAVRRAGIKVLSCFTNSDSVTCVVPREDVPTALEALHMAFVEDVAGNNGNGKPSQHIASS